MGTQVLWFWVPWAREVAGSSIIQDRVVTLNQSYGVGELGSGRIAVLFSCSAVL